MDVSPEAVAEVTEMLSWLSDTELEAARSAVRRVMRRAVARRTSGAHGSAAIECTPLEVAWLLILWQTSPEFLEEQFIGD